MSILSQHFDTDYLPREVLECAKAEFYIFHDVPSQAAMSSHSELHYNKEEHVGVC